MIGDRPPRVPNDHPLCPLDSSDVPRYATAAPRVLRSAFAPSALTSLLEGYSLGQRTSMSDPHPAPAAPPLKLHPACVGYTTEGQLRSPLPSAPSPTLSLSPSLTRRSGARRVSVSDIRVCQRHRFVSSSRPQSGPVCKSLPVAAVRRAPANADSEKGFFALNHNAALHWLGMPSWASPVFTAWYALPNLATVILH